MSCYPCFRDAAYPSIAPPIVIIKLSGIQFALIRYMKCSLSRKIAANAVRTSESVVVQRF